ncbi:PGBD-like superfamily [Sesbania bispinosa]|nr:PGBD-like superfamily [Sesbania bispinosa]
MAINMQSYLSALLLILLLLVDNSLSSGIPPTITRPVEAIDEVLKKPATEYLWDKLLQPIKDRNSKPQLPNALPRVNQNIPGLSRIKDYLSQFGYLQDTGPYNDVLDMHTISAISAYQKFFKLQVTGDLNTETIQQMSLPRCGVPDLDFEYNLTIINNVSWPKGKPQWFPVGTKNLTYGFHPASKVPLKMTKVFRDAFTRWSQTTRLVNFTESLKYDDADIKIGSYNFREGADDAVIGDSVIIRLRSGAKTGVIRLDSSKKLWMVEGNYTEGKFDLETTAMHQIGHLLGLEHSNNTDSIMYPAILPKQQRKVLITDSDNETIHQLYTADTNSRSVTSGSFALFGSSLGLITTFSLGFACMALSL